MANDGSAQRRPSAGLRLLPDTRDAYRQFVEITTRWSDNDAYGHVNNVVYYAWFDSAVNRILIEGGVLDVQNSSVIGLVVQSQCQYFRTISYPEIVQVGVRAGHIGNSSVRYELAVFTAGNADAAAQGNFVHVYVDRASNRPVPLPEPLRTLVEAMKASS
ncbi:acyl-CoA thioesterase [Microvirga tunisiensis]|uniref:Acyl-CoA thioesterase n=1 Tax=Microvirga tunisiensis TaxID=2108360 RepID=A0A5N7N3X2_9HYPH|nr:thioesterase family protein [Microvirga tunisiensis]MPR12354.1 acyl-CoA thioesterase [Microvirga tunisiensis]MPR30286.1 acyl-CoA thioesterase [Microvirga tunisiensis]